MNQRIGLTPRAIAACAVALLAHTARAQLPARIEGVLTDSVHNTPLLDATIFVVRKEPAQPEFIRVLISDKDGRYRLDSLTAGRYSVSFTHALLDSLDTSFPPREVVLATGEHARVDLGIPSANTLRLSACLGLQLLPEAGALVGRVQDAETELPLAGATVAVSWNDMAIDRATLRVTSTQRSGAARVDSAGTYRLCGLPTGSSLLIQVQKDGRAGSALRAEIPEDLGVRVLGLSFSGPASRALASIDSTSSSDTTTTPLLTGSAALTGTVRSSTGAPLSDVVLGVLDAAGSARTDSLGRFSLGGLPAGSQLLEARRIGYLVGRRPVDLRSGQTIDVPVRLDRIVSLDSIRIVAQRDKYREFEQHKRSGFGRFISEQQIAERNAIYPSDLLSMTPGLRVVGTGIDAKIVSSRGMTFSGRCTPNVVIDHMPNQDINVVAPRDIGGIEIYTDAAGGPPGANHGCGVIVIWTKR